jgi:hypothetical protein
VGFCTLLADARYPCVVYGGYRCIIFFHGLYSYSVRLRTVPTIHIRYVEIVMSGRDVTTH